MRSLENYFKHIKGETYIDKYPKNIVKLEHLKKGVLVEFGGGIGNDMKFLLNQGFTPEKLFFIESDKEVYNKAVKILKKNPKLPDPHFLLKDAKKTWLSDEIADFVYANNMLHCLENKDNVIAVLREAYRLLKTNGFFLGRTLLDIIDEEKREGVRNNPQSEKQQFAYKTTEALQKGILLGLSIEEMKEMGKRVGFSEVYAKVIPTSWAPIRDFYFRFKK